jgi:TonB family protein
MVEPSVPRRESLRDLTTPQQLQQEKPPSLSYPVVKPKRDKKPKAKKKTTIQKPQQPSSKGSSDESRRGASTGVRIGIGDGSGSSGFGFGSEYASQIGLSTFPFTYYLQTIHSRISNNWYLSQIKTGITGSLHTTILFKIFRSGHISQPEVVESSRNRTMDLSAIRAVRSAAPFPPLPNEYDDEYLIIRLIFEHNQ